MQRSPGGLPWKLVLQVFVVGLFALGLLVWGTIERRQPAPSAADRASSAEPVASTAQPSSPPVVATLAPTSNVAPPIAEPALPVRSESSVTTVTTVPNVQVAPAEPAAPAPRTGKVRFSVKPWGEVIVDGKSRGVSPPLKELAIPEGRHRIQIKNGDFPGYDTELEIKAGGKGEIAYSFNAP
jgi:cytoskeletal protein RodZ